MGSSSVHISNNYIDLMGRDYVLPMEENRNIDFESELSVNGEFLDGAVLEDGGEEVENSVETPEKKKPSEREEYELLIKSRFKELYAEDTQRLINRRFRKYKVMEERYKTLEESLALKEAELSESARRLEEYESLLRAEVERAVKETEERVINEIRAKQLRPSENGSLPKSAKSPFDVSRLTRGERASLAKRAAGGERIKF